MKKLGLIAGNKNFPLLFSSEAKSKDPSLYVVAVGIKGETDRRLSRIVDKLYWVEIGRLQQIVDIFLKEQICDVAMAGQISPYRIFQDRRAWDDLMHQVVSNADDFRPHSIFSETNL